MRAVSKRSHVVASICHGAVRLGATCLTLCVYAAALFAAEPPAKPVNVPFELLASKHMAVNVKINNKGPYRLIFDTGAPMTLLSNRAAKEAGVLPKDARPPLFGLFGAMGQFPIQTMEIGGLKAEKVSTIVIDHPAVLELSRALGPVDGIVGFPFFARYRLTIDYQAKELSFTANDYEPPDLLESLTRTILARQQPAPQVLAPGGLWGLAVSEDGPDGAAGVRIEAVRPGSAAAAAGLQPGDQLLTLNGRWTDTVLDCYQAAAPLPAGKPVPILIRRDGQEVRLRLTPRAGL